jgi:hypothetical protein
LTEGPELVVDLHGKLPGGAQYQRDWTVTNLGARLCVDVYHAREHVRQRLAAPCLREAHTVAAEEH